jgi:TolA-binding protein
MVIMDTFVNKKNVNEGNNMKKKLMGLYIAGLLVGMTSQSAMSLPKGAPFVELDEKITAVQGTVASLEDQVAMLVGHVGSLEERLSANESAITELEDQNAALTALMQQNLSSVADIEAEILILKADADSNANLILDLQSSILMVESNLISLDDSLQEQIDNNSALIGLLQASVNNLTALLETKQNLINGTCPNGTAVQQIQSDGSFVCANVSGGGNSTIYSGIVIQIEYGTGSYNLDVDVTCPHGAASGMGYMLGPGVEVVQIFTSALSSDTGHISAINNSGGPSQLIGLMTCVDTVPYDYDGPTA